MTFVVTDEDIVPRHLSERVRDFDTLAKNYGGHFRYALWNGELRTLIEFSQSKVVCKIQWTDSHLIPRSKYH